MKFLKLMIIVMFFYCSYSNKKTMQNATLKKNLVDKKNNNLNEENKNNQLINYEIKRTNFDNQLKNVNLHNTYIHCKGIDFYRIDCNHDSDIHILLMNINNQLFFPLFFKSDKIPKDSLYLFEGKIDDFKVKLNCIDSNGNQVLRLEGIKLCGAGVGKDFFNFDKALISLDSFAPRITSKILKDWYK